MAGDRERALAAGFDGYLTKPIEVSTFGETVEQMKRGE
jgi:CheY-like chemotaxis protein